MNRRQKVELLRVRPVALVNLDVRAVPHAGAVQVEHVLAIEVRDEGVSQPVLDDVPELGRQADRPSPQLDVRTVHGKAVTNLKHKVRSVLGHVVSLVRLVVRDVPLLRGGAVERVRLDVGARRVTVRDGIDYLRVGGARLDHVRAVGNGSSAFLGLGLLGGVGRGVGVRRVRGSSCRLRLRISRTVDLASDRRLLLPCLLRAIGRRR